MINHNFEILQDELKTTQMINREIKDPEERLAISNHLLNMYKALICMGDVNTKYTLGGTYINKINRKKYFRRLKIYNNMLIDNYILNKDFHAYYFGTILPEVEDGLEILSKVPVIEKQSLSEDDFFTIFYLFLESIGLEKEFDKFYKNCHVHSTIIGESDKNLGFTTYNPFTKDIDIFVNDFKFDYTCMNTLAHEFGHGYDFTKLDCNIEDYNRYLYVSFFGESISRLMERLLNRFLIRNDIHKEESKDNYANCLITFYESLLSSYVLSLLDNDFIRSGGYESAKPEVIMNKIKKDFINIPEMLEFISNIVLDLSDENTYAYGDINSLFLVDEVESVGFNGKLMNSYMKHRCELFDERFFQENGLGPKKYIKLYRKEVDFVK